jgi:mono/diheme cytochrome c family protein
MRAATPSLVLLLVASVATAAGPELRFRRAGAEVRRLDRDALAAACAPETITLDDPYYEGRKTYRALPLACVLTAGLGDAATLRDQDVVLRALDGYEKPTTGAVLLAEGGFVAIADAERASGWAPIERAGKDPGPFYVVWTRPGQRDTHIWPWPYQLAEIEVTDWRATHPHAVPSTAPPDAPAWRGFALFRERCVACHAVNGEGGRVGPDLNVPQSIVEYRAVPQLKQFIRAPQTFRYGNMPAHPDLTDADLDALIAYFETMKGLKHDPQAAR